LFSPVAALVSRQLQYFKSVLTVGYLCQAGFSSSQILHTLPGAPRTPFLLSTIQKGRVIVKKALMITDSNLALFAKKP
jgi:hypothetical protein